MINPLAALDAARPRQKLARFVARGRERDISHVHRPVPPIEKITVAHVDSATGRIVEISLPRLRWLERSAS